MDRRVFLPASLSRSPASFVRLLLLIVLCGATSTAFAGSRLIFPRFSFETGTITGIALVNPGLRDAVVTLTARDAQGQLLSGPGFNNPSRAWTVKAGQQLAQLLHEWFGASLPANRVGWVEATSDADGITGFFLFLNLAGTVFDGADLPATASQIIFNQVEVNATTSTELNLVNPGQVPAKVNLRLEAPGIPAITKSVTLSPLGMARLDAGDHFGLSQIPGSAYVRVISDTPVAGFEFVKDSRGDLIGLNAQHDRQQFTEIFFPQMAVLGPWKTEIGLVNYSGSPVILTITAYQPDGNPYGSKHLVNNPVNRSLDQNGSLREDVATLFGFRGSQVLDGWIKVQATQPSVNGYIRYGIPETGSVALVAAPAEGTTRALFSHIATVGDFFTGLAILNPSLAVANLRVMAFTRDGKSLGSFDTALAPGHRLSKLINELVANSAGQGGGFIWVKSDIPVYSTSLFGTAKILANIPPQTVSSQFTPDSGTPLLSIDPPVALLQPSTGMQFKANGVQGQVAWKVNGIAGGNDAVGRIRGDGTYTAPVSPPAAQVVTISAEEAGGRSIGASVELIRKEELFAGLGLVSAVAYLGTLKKLYEAELFGLSPGGSRSMEVGPTAVQSSIFELLPQGGRVQVSTFANEEISDMVPFTASNGKEFMLLAARNSGRILRLDPVQPEQPREVAGGLVKPGSMVLDRVSGNLLVAEESRISTVSRTNLEAGLRTAPQSLAKRRPSPGPVRASSLFQASASSLAVDECTGNIYFTDLEAGTINVYSKATGQTSVVAGGLLEPTDLLAVYRQGQSCPAALNLLVVERAAGWVTLVLPYSGQQYIWIEVPSAFDVTFLPDENPFTGVAGILIGQFGDEGSDLFFVDLPDDYGLRPTNGLADNLCVGSVFLADPDLETSIRSALGLQPGSVISCEEAQRLVEVEAPTEEILFLDGIEFFPLLQDVRLEDNIIFDLEPLRPLSLIHTLDLSDNLLFEVEALRDLDLLWQLDVSNNFISDVSPLIDLWDLDYLDLSNNLIEDVDLLVLNFGLGDGDFIDLSGNLLDFDDCRGLQQLAIQGVEVWTDVPCEELPNKGDLGLQIVAHQDPVASEGTLAYTVRLTNWSSATATEILFIDLLPLESSFRSVDTGGFGECEIFSDVLLVCYFEELWGLYYLDFTIETEVLALPGSVLYNYAWTSSDEFDTDIEDNRSELTTAVAP